MSPEAVSAAGFDVDVHRQRLAAASVAASDRGIDALLITPSPDYAYLLGYAAPALERLTCLVVRADGDPALVVPRLEQPLAIHHLGELADAIDVRPWDETEDPFRLLRSLVHPARRVAFQDQMWARFALRIRAALDPAEAVEAGPAMSSLRRIKTPPEIERLRAAATAADSAMRAITAERLSARTEAEVSRHVRELLLANGHDLADFAIVASGPNSASPHHTPGERMIGEGDAVVLDIGGTRAGYCSDTTRTAFVGEVPATFASMYDVLRRAQAAACDAVAPGVACSAIDALAREVITEAGFGDAFIHRTGHGIGMEGHEEPYIVADNDEPLQAGHAFSIEPGIYIEGVWGARIEDIVICTDAGGERLNTTSTELYIVA
jgi:Xaa-Pro aminopeptidase